jgi:hypothetical protein
MHSIERGRAFAHALRAMTQRRPWDERPCPHCGGHDTGKHGTYTRHPWTREGRQPVRVQRDCCRRCRRTVVPALASVAARRWYGRDVQRRAIDQWQHGGSALRRIAEHVRSWVGKQERWRRWRPWAPAPGERCALGASTVHRWRDQAGQRVQATVADQLAGVPASGQLGADGRWAKLRGKARGVVLLLSDSVTGLVSPPVVVDAEEGPRPWQALFRRAAQAGLPLGAGRGVTSDGARGLAQYLEQTLVWVHQQRGVFHRWRNLAPVVRAAATVAATGRQGAAATAVRRATRRALAPVVRAVCDAVDDTAAVTALKALAAHPLGAGLAAALRNEVDAAFVYREGWNRGLVRVGPEWWWRDVRVRLSHGRNHRSLARRERAALVGAIDHNFTPAPRRTERKRTYRRSGHSPLAMTGVAPGEVSYLDALAI